MPKPVPCCDREPNVGVFWFAKVPNDAVLLLVPPNLQVLKRNSEFAIIFSHWKFAPVPVITMHSLHEDTSKGEIS